MSAVRAAVVRYWILPVLLFVWWAVVAVNDFNQIVMPYPQDVFAAIVRDRDAYVTALLPTLGLSLGGLAAGLLAGGTCAVLVWSSRLVAGVLTPMALLLNSVPVVAMIPVLARVLGYGQLTVFVVTAIICFLPAFVFVGARLATPPASLGDVYTVLGANKAVRLTRLLLPHALPGLLVALRVSAPTAVLAVLLGQYLMGAVGLGKMFSSSITYSQNQQAWGVAVVATVVSTTLFFAARAVADRAVARLT
ncbi:ABC transporter permease subunit [Rhodococcus sp. NPDC047139]|uniref:ABC transporter permease n=1 Tax=Rhodococcus sp. NPDC047139 TaxID=3155141 RepID=UPI0033EA1823